VLAITVGRSSSSSNKGGDDALELLAVRTIDPPSRMSYSSSSSAAGAETGLEEEGVWKARKGGMSRGVVRRMVGMCVERGGVGEEVLRGLEGFS